MLAQMGEEYDDAELRRVFRKADVDGSGSLEFTNFCCWWEAESKVLDGL